MGPDKHQEQHDARVLEIIVALLLGLLTGVVLVGIAWLFGRFALPPRELWNPVIRLIAVGMGGLVVIGWLLRSSRRGL